MRTGRNGRSHALAGRVLILPRRMQDKTCLLARSQNRAMAGAGGRHLLLALETRWHSWQHLADSSAHVCNWGRRETRSRAALPPPHLLWPGCGCGTVCAIWLARWELAESLILCCQVHIRVVDRCWLHATGRDGRPRPGSGWHIGTLLQPDTSEAGAERYDTSTCGRCKPPNASDAFPPLLARCN